MKARLRLIILKKLFVLPDYYFTFGKYAKKPENYYAQTHAYLKKNVRKISVSGKIKVTAIGIENIPKEDGFVFYPNHQGMYDVLIFLDTCPNEFSFIIKKESTKVPILKQIIKATGSIPMDRDDIRQSMQVIIEATKRVKEGRNFLIFAEGTRSRNGNVTGEFKGGSFRIATKAKAPIIPCALINSFVPFDSPSTDPIEVKLVYLKPMYYDEYKEMSTNDIAIEVKRRIDEAIQHYS